MGESVEDLVPGHAAGDDRSLVVDRAVAASALVAPLAFLTGEVVGIVVRGPFAAPSASPWIAQHVLFLIGAAALLPALVVVAHPLRHRWPTLALVGVASAGIGNLSALGILTLDLTAPQLTIAGPAPLALFQRLLAAPVVAQVGLLQAALPVGLLLLAGGLGRTRHRWSAAAIAAAVVLGALGLGPPVRIASRALLAAGFALLAHAWMQAKSSDENRRARCGDG